MTGFRGRSGRSFRARLALMQTPEGKWRVEFDEPWAREGAKAPEIESERRRGRTGPASREGPPSSSLVPRGAVSGAPPWAAMGLTIVTGPANAAKAQQILERYRAGARARADPGRPAGRPTSTTTAASWRPPGSVLGVRVEPFGGLMREIARAPASPPRRSARPRASGSLASVSSRARLDVPRRGCAVARLRRLARRLLRRARGAARRARPLHGGASRLGAGRLAARGATPRSSRGALLELPGRARAPRAPRPGARSRPPLSTRCAWPRALGAHAVFIYGFDDLDPIQLDAVETLAHRVGAPVTISLPGEGGRLALAERAATLETLRPSRRGDRRAGRRPRTSTRTPELHQLERVALRGRAARLVAGAAVRLLEGGDERAEPSSSGATSSALAAAGCAAARHRGRHARASARRRGLVRELLDSRAIPCTPARRERFADTALGGALLALLRTGLLGGGAADLVRWLRAPGSPRPPAPPTASRRGLLRRGHGRLDPARAGRSAQQGFARGARSPRRRAAAAAGADRARRARARRAVAAPWRAAPRR